MRINLAKDNGAAWSALTVEGKLQHKVAVAVPTDLTLCEKFRFKSDVCLAIYYTVHNPPPLFCPINLDPDKPRR